METIYIEVSVNIFHPYSIFITDVSLVKPYLNPHVRRLNKKNADELEKNYYYTYALM